MAVCVAGLTIAGWSDQAAAHSFLVATAPAQGQRLDAGPDLILLEFTERVEPSTATVELRTGDGSRVEATAPAISDDGLEARIAVDRWHDGIYVVAWSAFSAADGHGSSGEFAFAVGDVAGALPSASTASPTDIVAIGTSWLFFAGLAAAAGALLLRIGTPDAERVRQGVVVVAVGLVVAMVAVVVELARARSDIGLLLGCLNALAVGLLMIRFRRGSAWAAGAIVVAIGVWAARGHGATANGVFGWAVDVLHLLSTAAWSGSLVFVAAIAWSRRRVGEAWLPLVRRYSGRAAVLVVAAAGTGVAAGWELVPTWDALVSDGYGRLVSTKAVLLLVAVSLAVTARVGLLAGERVGGLRRVVTAESVVVIAALGVAAFLVNGAPPRPASAAETLLGPPPMEGAVGRAAGLAGQLAVYIGADGDRLDVQVVTPSGPVRGTSVELAAVAPDGTEVDLQPRPCGPGCFTQDLPLAAGTTSLHVSASAPDWIGGTYTAELVQPAGDPAPEVLAEVISRMRAIDAVAITETVSSGPGSQTPTGTITLDGATFIQGEPYAAGNVHDVRIRRGTPDRLVVYLPGSLIYAELDIDDQHRIRAARFITPGHEITRTFAYLEN